MTKELRPIKFDCYAAYLAKTYGAILEADRIVGGVRVGRDFYNENGRIVLEAMTGVR